MATNPRKTIMRVTIGELLGKLSAQDGQAIETDLRRKTWEAGRDRLRGAKAVVTTVKLDAFERCFPTKRAREAADAAIDAMASDSIREAVDAWLAAYKAAGGIIERTKP